MLDAAIAVSEQCGDHDFRGRRCHPEYKLVRGSFRVMGGTPAAAASFREEVCPRLGRRTVVVGKDYLFQSVRLDRVKKGNRFFISVF